MFRTMSRVLFVRTQSDATNRRRSGRRAPEVTMLEGRMLLSAVHTTHVHSAAVHVAPVHVQRVHHHTAHAHASATASAQQSPQVPYPFPPVETIGGQPVTLNGIMPPLSALPPAHNQTPGTPHQPAPLPPIQYIGGVPVAL